MKHNQKLTMNVATVLGIIVSPAAYAAASSFQVFDPPKNFISQGRCHMDSCSTAKWLAVHEESRNSDSITLQVTLQGGDVPMGKPKSQTTWNKAPHFVKIVCSRKNPTVGHDELDLADENGVAAVLASAESLYFQACHSSAEVGPPAAKKFGYIQANTSKPVVEDHTFTSNPWKTTFEQTTLWHNADLTKLEGWWAWQPEGCNDTQDNQYRFSFGRREVPNEGNQNSIIFGRGVAAISQWEHHCDIKLIGSPKPGTYTFDGNCESLGEKMREVITVKRTSPYTAHFTVHTKGQKKPASYTAVQCARENLITR